MARNKTNVGGHSRRRRGMLALAGFLLAALACGLIMDWLSVKTETGTFTESAQALQNPNCGFYRIYTFLISDEEEDYQPVIEERYRDDTDTSLALIEINLQTYRSGEISAAGLANIDALFYALEAGGKQLIVRFLYDWEGENRQQEPQSLSIILTHMRQLEGILRRHSQSIFTMQGLFVGNWGEMNGTRFGTKEDFQMLAQQLFSVTGGSVYLAVRTPAQWRGITQCSGELKLEGLSARLGLFNDGMLGNENDWGTYGPQDVGEGYSRQEELAFQEELCCVVPNGGEVIAENPYNDFENAVKDLATMHVTYLNKDYDRAVLDKWAQTTVEENGCFNGMDGLTYIKRHLGYRLLIQDARLSRGLLQDFVSAEITFQNVGFAPLYKEPEIRLTLRGESGEEGLTVDIAQGLCAMPGGNRPEETVTLRGAIPLKELAKGRYAVYISLVDPDSGDPILLANDQDRTKDGYRIGSLELR